MMKRAPSTSNASRTELKRQRLVVDGDLALRIVKRGDGPVFDLRPKSDQARS
jgi:hypothetical protein